MKVAVHAFALLFLAASTWASALNKPLSFEGYKVLRIEVPTKAKFEALSSLENVDFWREGRVGGSVDLMAGPSDLAEVTKFLEAENYSYSVMIQNVEDLIKLEKVKSEKKNI